MGDIYMYIYAHICCSYILACVMYIYIYTPHILLLLVALVVRSWPWWVVPVRACVCECV